MKTFRSIIRWLLLGMVMAGVGLGIYYAVRPKPIHVDVATVTRGPLQVTVDEDGRTRIKERYVVSAPLSGRLLRVELEPGDPVTRGNSRLASIAPRNPDLLDARELQQTEMRVKAREAELVRTKPDVEKAKAALEYAESNLARTSQLVPERAATRDELDKAKREYRVFQEEYRSAIYAQQIAKFELELARAALVRTKGNDDADFTDFEIFSPIDGCVLRVLQESATVVTPGMPLVEVGDPADLEAVVDVLSSDAVKIQGGDPVFLERWGGDHVLNGKVRLVEPSAFTKISALGVEEQRVNVVIDLVDPVQERQTLGDGFRVEARIVTWERPDVVKIPIGAKYRDGDRSATYVVQSNHRASLRHVTIGKQNDSFAEVLQGLEPGDVVILHPSDKIQDGTRIDVR